MFKLHPGKSSKFSATHSIFSLSCVRSLPQWGQNNFLGTHLSEAAMLQYPSQDKQVKCHIVSLLTRILYHKDNNCNPTKDGECNHPVECSFHVISGLVATFSLVLLHKRVLLSFVVSVSSSGSPCVNEALMLVCCVPLSAKAFPTRYVP